MYLIVWSYLVRPGCEADFERAYGPHGEWVRLFSGSPGYIGTELHRTVDGSGRYLTIDRWGTAEAYHAMRRDTAAAYRSIDADCDRLTAEEHEIGRFTEVD